MVTNRSSVFHFVTIKTFLVNFPTCRIPRFLDIFGKDLFLVNKLLTEKDPKWKT
jgi:hypothetical protein